MAIRTHTLYPVRAAHIVVRPGCSDMEKAIAPGQPGEIKIAVRASADLDLSEIEPTSLMLHGASAGRTSLETDEFGNPMLVAVFDTRKVHLRQSATRIRLTGWLKDSQAFIAEDPIVVVREIRSSNTNCR
jgi:hypothetical protein